MPGDDETGGDPLTHQRCLALLRELGGRILVEHDVQESFSGDGLIVAYFGREAIDWTDIPLSYNRYSTSLFRNPLYDLARAQVDLQWARGENVRLQVEIERLNVVLASR